MFESQTHSVIKKEAPFTPPIAYSSVVDMFNQCEVIQMVFQFKGRRYKGAYVVLAGCGTQKSEGYGLTYVYLYTPFNKINPDHNYTFVGAFSADMNQVADLSNNADDLMNYLWAHRAER